VRFYLSIVVEGEDGVVVVFPVSAYFTSLFEYCVYIPGVGKVIEEA
jgi:hypothetical protein